MKNFTLFFALLFNGCVALPSGIYPVQKFDLNRYLGNWYEIARLDHSFERGLNNVSAEYSLRQDGGVKVLNRGYDPLKKVWKQAEGRAYFLSDPTTGSLKVSFFWPFYGGYNIIDLDRDTYAHALVCGPDRSYLWILSRATSLDRKIIDELVRKAEELGFDTSALIYVSHDN